MCRALLPQQQRAAQLLPACSFSNVARSFFTPQNKTNDDDDDDDETQVDVEVHGAAARDIARNFIQRWNHHAVKKTIRCALCLSTRRFNLLV